MRRELAHRLHLRDRLRDPARLRLPDAHHRRQPGRLQGQGDGSLIKRDGVVVGSALIGQQFYEPVIGKNGKPSTVKGVVQTQPDPRYFQTRPSAHRRTPTTRPAPAFSNLGPNDKATLAGDPGQHRDLSALKLDEAVRPGADRVAQIPVDAVDDSASAIDPDISRRQRADPGLPHRRGAAPLARHGPQPDLASTRTATASASWASPASNVLEINLALDRLTGSN